MTLDEAIKHCEEKAKELRVEAEEARDIGEYTSSPKQPYNVPVKNCLECAEEHEQLAKWLKELKRLRESERPQGEWSFDSEFLMIGSPYGSYKCSNCGTHTDDKEDNFCWNCGADMRGKNEKRE